MEGHNGGFLGLLLCTVKPKAENGMSSSLERMGDQGQEIRCNPLLAQGSQSECVVALCKAYALFIAEEPGVEVCRCLQVERALEEDLPRG